VLIDDLDQRIDAGQQQLRALLDGRAESSQAKQPFFSSST
jgi:hypothetical protein